MRLSNALSRRLFAALAASLFILSGIAQAEELYCEVMSVEGTATLSNAATSGKAVVEGDLLSVDDVLEVGASSYVDLAYDKDWNNVTRVEENSSIRIRSLTPPEVDLDSGGLFAKLKSLPKDSSFNVQTPTAIATVRGTEYRTTYLEGETQVYNVSDSDVYVYGVDASGQKQEAEPVIVRNTEKTFVPHRGDMPQAPRRMERADIQRAANFRQGIEQKVQQNVQRGRVGKLPDVGEVGRRIQERRQNMGGMDGEMKGSERPGQPRTLSGDEAAASTRRLRSVEGESSKGGLAEPYFPGGERQRHDAMSEGSSGESRGEQNFEGAREQQGQQGGQMGRSQERPEGQGFRKEGRSNNPSGGQASKGERNNQQQQGKPSQARPAGRPRAQR